VKKFLAMLLIGAVLATSMVPIVGCGGDTTVKDKKDKDKDKEKKKDA
jgi:hypothetical protein